MGRRWLGAVSLCLGLLAFATPVGRAAWQSPVTIARPAGECLHSPAFAGDRHGNAIAVWERFVRPADPEQSDAYLGLNASFRAAKGSFGPVERIYNAAQDHMYEPHVALDRHGNALAVWVRVDERRPPGTTFRIQAAFRPRGGSFGVPETIARAQFASAPRVAFDSRGNAIAIWAGFDGSHNRIQAAFRPAGGSFESPSTISEPGKWAWAHQVAFDRDGNAIALWVADVGGSSNYRGAVQVALRPAGGAFGPAQTISDPSRDAREPQLAFDHSGNATAVWAQRVETPSYPVVAAFRPAGGSFGIHRRISKASWFSHLPRVTIDRDGNATAAWSRFDGSDERVETAFRPAGGSFGAAEAISEPGHDAKAAQVAADGRNNVVAVWELYWPERSIQASFRPAGGSFAAPETISQPGQDAGEPRVAVDRLGNATAVWVLRGGRCFEGIGIQSAFRPRAGGGR